MTANQSDEQRIKFAVAQGEFVLQRNPQDTSLQAWDAADEFLLKHVHDTLIVFAGNFIYWLPC